MIEVDPARVLRTIIKNSVSCTLFVSCIGAGALGCQSRAERSAVERGRAAFARICSGCHGFDGKGGGRTGFAVPPRDLTDPTFQASHTDEQLLFTLRNGKGQMPAFGALLPASEQLELITYIRSLGGAQGR